jgi:hypothetical protein
LKKSERKTQQNSRPKKNPFVNLKKMHIKLPKNYRRMQQQPRTWSNNHSITSSFTNSSKPKDKSEQAVPSFPQTEAETSGKVKLAAVITRGSHSHFDLTIASRNGTKSTMYYTKT